MANILSKDPSYFSPYLSLYPAHKMLILFLVSLFDSHLTESLGISAGEGSWIQVFNEDGNWLSWESWGSWSESCGAVTRSRTRICAEPKLRGLEICIAGTPGGFETEDQVLGPCPGR